MYDKPMLSLMADHNRRMNDKLYAVCAGIPDEARKRDLGASFRSIHGTFNHLLLVDRLWLGRITGKPFPIRSLDQELYADFDTLERERADTDAVIAGFIAGLRPARLAEPVTYISFVKQESVTLPLGLILTHLFHHQTHHRGHPAGARRALPAASSTAPRCRTAGATGPDNTRPVHRCARDRHLLRPRR